jgi:hypothetical protein
MFTSNAVQQLAADHRRSMMAEAQTSRTIHAASHMGTASGSASAPGKFGHSWGRHHARSMWRSMGAVATLRRS